MCSGYFSEQEVRRDLKLRLTEQLRSAIEEAMVQGSAVSVFECMS